MPAYKRFLLALHCLESTTNLLYMNSTPTGKMDSLTLCVPFLMTLHSKTIFNDFTFENPNVAAILILFYCLNTVSNTIDVF